MLAGCFVKSQNFGDIISYLLVEDWDCQFGIGDFGWPGYFCGDVSDLWVVAAFFQ